MKRKIGEGKMKRKIRRGKNEKKKFKDIRRRSSSKKLLILSFMGISQVV